MPSRSISSSKAERNGEENFKVSSGISPTPPRGGVDDSGATASSETVSSEEGGRSASGRILSRSLIAAGLGVGLCLLILALAGAPPFDRMARVLAQQAQSG